MSGQTVYLRLYGGREDPYGEPDRHDIVLGPLAEARVSGLTYVSVTTPDGRDHDFKAVMPAGLIGYGGRFYGDFAVLPAPGGVPTPFDPEALQGPAVGAYARVLAHRPRVGTCRVELSLPPALVEEAGLATARRVVLVKTPAGVLGLRPAPGIDGGVRLRSRPNWGGYYVLSPTVLTPLAVEMGLDPDATCRAPLKALLAGPGPGLDFPDVRVEGEHLLVSAARGGLTARIRRAYRPAHLPAGQDRIRVALPRRLCEKVGWAEGTPLNFAGSENRRTFRIKPVAPGEPGYRLARYTKKRLALEVDVTEGLAAAAADTVSPVRVESDAPGGPFLFVDFGRGVAATQPETQGQNAET